MSVDQDPTPLSWDDAGEGWTSAPAELSRDSLPGLAEIPPEQTFWNACGKGLACACSAGAGAATSHIGCIVSPTLAFMGAASGASLSVVSVVASTVLTGAGLALWYKLRGKTASRMEKGLTVAGAVTGAVMTASLHLSGVFAGHDHHATMDAALDWYRDQPQTTQISMQENARSIGMSLEEYVLQICGTPGTENISYPTEAALNEAFEANSDRLGLKTGAPGLDKL